MPPTGRNLPNGDREEQWLGPDLPGRTRPWAYEELLLGAERLREQAQELDAVVEELRLERDELARLHVQLDEHFARIAELEQKLRELAPAAEPTEDPTPARVLPHTVVPASAETTLHASSSERDYALTRCEGFQVDSPTGPVGFVEGLRFASRIDRPDLLEVRGGRFGRRLLLIPSEAVNEVRLDEELVVVRAAPVPTGDLLADLFARIRRALLGTPST
jgi:hypothetical protein